MFAPQTIYKSIDILPWSQIALLSTLALCFMDKNAKWVTGPLVKLFLLFYVVIVVTSFFAFIPSLAWDARNIILTWFLVFFLTISLVNTEKRMVLIFLAYCLFSFKMSQHGAVSWAEGAFHLHHMGLTGAPGWFRNSGEYTIQMLILDSLDICLCLFIKDYWGKNKKWIFYMLRSDRVYDSSWR